MGQYILKATVVAMIEKFMYGANLEADIASTGECFNEEVANAKYKLCKQIKEEIDTLEVKEVDYDKEVTEYLKNFENANIGHRLSLRRCAKHFFKLGFKAQHDNWKVVDNTNLPQEDKTKIYCVFTKQRYILAKVISHPQDDDLLQWKCTEFPHHRYDMCEGDKYMQIV